MDVVKSKPPANKLARVWRQVVKNSRSAYMRARFDYRQKTLNRASQSLFQRQPTMLTVVQTRVVHDLTNRGIAFVHFDELIGEPDAWRRQEQAFERFVESDEVRAGLQKFQPGSGTKDKDYLVTQFLYSKNAIVPADNPTMQLGLNRRLLDVVNAYLGMWSKLFYFDMWYTIPVGANVEAKASQNWHRDPEDTQLIKVFLYYQDVDEQAGPLNYVAGSRLRGGRYSHLYAQAGIYPPPGELEKQVDADDKVVCIGKAGTFVLADTSGFHRGGMALTRPRIFATWGYSTPASVHPRRFSVDWAGTGEPQDEIVRYAIN